MNSTTDLAEIKKAGFTVVCGPAETTFLDAAQTEGLKVLASPNALVGPRFNATALRATVGKFDSHPALWAWYLADEPDLDGVPPKQVIEAQKLLKSVPAHKPTALVIYQGYEALNYANITDILMIDRYPVPWLPLANFGQHITLARLALGKDAPLIAVIQAFDWNSFKEMLPGEDNLRPPTYEEMRCMTYEALARGANGLFYFAYESGGWKIREHPETWAGLQAVVKEVNERFPLFMGKPQWWRKDHTFGDPAHRFNAALESSITSTLLRVTTGNDQVTPGYYILAVNNTERTHQYSFALPQQQPRGDSSQTVPVLGENRAVTPVKNRLTDTFGPFSVHLYGPLP